MKNCLLCKKELIRRQEKFCSRSCMAKYRAKIPGIWNTGLTSKTDGRLAKSGKKSRETNRKQYENGRKGWNNGLTKETNKSVAETGRKNSIILKAKYVSGELQVWNKNLTKETNLTLLETGKKHSQVMKQKFAIGEMVSPNKDKILSKEVRAKISLAQGGTGVPGENSEYPFEFNDCLKRKIRERNNYECQNCNLSEEEHLFIYGINLGTHHIDYDKKNCSENNLITLCKQCNTRANFNREYWKEHYQSKIYERVPA